MFQLVFAVIFLCSAWAAWRRNPLYSRRSALRSIAVVLLAIAGAIALIIAAVKLTAGRSAAVSFSAIGVVIVVDTLTLIFVIQTFTTPQESKPTSLPHATKLVTTNRVKVYKWAKVFAIIIAVSAIPGLLISADIRFVFFAIAAVTAFLAIILLPVLYWTNRGFDQSLTALELGPWVHWQYTPSNGQHGATSRPSASAPPRPLSFSGATGTVCFGPSAPLLLAFMCSAPEDGSGKPSTLSESAARSWPLSC
jgi:hypothetical protein